MEYRILKESEYEKCKYALPNPGRRFWIESERELGTKRCGFVNDDGVVDKNGTFCSDTTLWLRPVIEYGKDEKKDIVFKEGQKVILHGLEWTAISDNILVCDRCVEEVKFDDSSTGFEDSYLKYVLYQYMKKRSSEEAFLSPAESGSGSLEQETEDGEISSGFLVNLFALLLAAGSGVLCALAFNPFTVALSALTVAATALVMKKYNSGKIKEGIKKSKKKYRKEIIAAQSEVKDAVTEKPDYALSLEGIEEGEVRTKAEEVNKLLEGLMKTGNRAAIAKVKFFYTPETQKTLELYHKIAENDIDTPNVNECMNIISENLDKTIRLLKIEYDKAASDDLLDAQLSSGVIGKMLSDAENQEQSRLVLK